MSNIAGDISQKIQVEETSLRSGSSGALFKKMGAIANYMLANIQKCPVGTIKKSILSLAQFQAQMGSGWVLCDGSSAAGTAYGALGYSNLPDGRGVFLRGKDNGAGRTTELALGAYQECAIYVHDHSGTLTFGSVTPLKYDGTNRTLYDASFSQNIIWDQQPVFMGTSFNPTYTAGNSGEELRPFNVSVNFFIKVN
jgi:hypothetical protein